MSTKQEIYNPRSGSVLFVVMIMTTLGALAVGSILTRTLNKIRLTDRQICREQAFYIAQGGAERAASWIADDNEYTTQLTGTLGCGSYVTDINCTTGSNGEKLIDITAVGTVKNVSRTVSMRGVRRVSWSRYALWYDQETTKLWISCNEMFEGRVYSKPQLHFHHFGLPSQAVFTEHVASGASSIETSNSEVQPIFEQGLSLNVEQETMASVSFPDMLTVATSGGLVLEGPTSIEIEGTTMKVTNTEAGWNNQNVPFPANGMIYVKNPSVTTYEWVIENHRWVQKKVTGNVDIAAPNGLEGRLTIVSEDDINIIDHVRYKTNPQSYPDSTDALGLIAKENVVVETTAPNDVDIYAHMIAVDGGFGVKNYSSGYSRGYLNVYGGIVNLIRNAVGIVGGAGYSKNYMYDRRFLAFPPPNYPKLAEELEWTEWEG